VWVGGGGVAVIPTSTDTSPHTHPHTHPLTHTPTSTPTAHTHSSHPQLTHPHTHSPQPTPTAHTPTHPHAGTSVVFVMHARVSTARCWRPWPARPRRHGRPLQLGSMARSWCCRPSATRHPPTRTRLVRLQPTHLPPPLWALLCGPSSPSFSPGCPGGLPVGVAMARLGCEGCVPSPSKEQQQQEGEGRGTGCHLTLTTPAPCCLSCVHPCALQAGVGSRALDCSGVGSRRRLELGISPLPSTRPPPSLPPSW
jgi:hypothetical protein